MGESSAIIMTNVPPVCRLAVYPKELKTRVQTKPCAANVHSSTIHSSYRAEMAQCLSVRGRTRRRVLHPHDRCFCCSATKRPSTDAGTTWANPRGSTLSERSAAWNVTLYGSIHMTFKNRQSWSKVPASALVAAGATGEGKVTAEKTVHGPRGWRKRSMPWPRVGTRGAHLSALIKPYTWNGVL